MPVPLMGMLNTILSHYYWSVPFGSIRKSEEFIPRIVGSVIHIPPRTLVLKMSLSNRSLSDGRPTH